MVQDDGPRSSRQRDPVASLCGVMAPRVMALCASASNATALMYECSRARGTVHARVTSGDGHS